LSGLVSHGKDRHEMAGKNKLHAPHWSEILNLFLQAGCFPWYFVGVCFLKCRKRRSDQEVTVSTFFRVDMADTTLVEAQVLSAVSFVLFHLTVILLALTSTQKNMWIIALVLHIFFSIIIGAVRQNNQGLQHQWRCSEKCAGSRDLVPVVPATNVQAAAISVPQARKVQS